ncbi:MAG: hypothetical protein ACXVGH_09295 [Mycobacteriales bacterium]
MTPLSRFSPLAVLLGGLLLTAACQAGRPTATGGPAARVAAVEHAAVVTATGRAAAEASRTAAARAAASRAAQARRTAALRAASARAASLRAASLRAEAARTRVLPAPLRAAAPVAAAAAVLRPVAAAETPAQRGARVLASLHYPYQALGYRFVFLPGRAGYLGLTDAGARQVTIWVRSSESDPVLAHTIAHELGHVLDFTRGTPVRRARYLLVRGLPSQPWLGCDGCTDFRTPAGDWAEVFAQWVAGPGDFRSEMAGAPTRAQLTALDALFTLS